MRLRDLRAAGLLALLITASAPFASSHLNDYTKAGGSPQQDHWPQGRPIVWNINATHGGNISGARPVEDIIAAAFNTWASAPNASLNVVRGADTSKTSSGMDDTNLICFTCSGDFNSEAETLAVTMTTTATSAGGSDGRGGTTQFAGQ
jgi:hypothetical protein